MTTDPFKQCQRPNTPTAATNINVNDDVIVNVDTDSKNTVGHTLVVSGLDASNQIQIC